jgi:hypothetical protein
MLSHQRSSAEVANRVSIKGFWQMPQWLFPSCHSFFLCQVVALALPTYYVFMPKVAAVI